MKWRVIVNALMVFIVFLLLGAKVAYLQVLQHDSLKTIFEKQFIKQEAIEPIRGEILDVKGELLAVSILVDSYYCMPNEVEDPKKTALFLSNYLDLDANNLEKDIRRKKTFFWIKRKVLPQEAIKINSKNLPQGIGHIKEGMRCYPKAGLASHVIGISSTDNRGLLGVEYKFNDFLKGDTITWNNGKDALGRKVASDSAVYADNRTSNNIYLTFDEVIQHIAERNADKLWQKNKPEAISIVVQKIDTGEILAMVSRPNFDVNNIKSASSRSLSNNSVSMVYEPGSTLKVFVAAAAIEEKIADLDTVIDCENGKLAVEDHVITDHEKKGMLSLKEVISYSSNIGMAKIGQQLGNERLYKYLVSFGFGSFTGITLPGESRGLFRYPNEWSEISKSVIAFGQEIGINPIQLIAGYSCIANKGVLLEPRIIKYIKDYDGNVIRDFSPRVVRRVVSEGTCKKIIEAMEAVVSKGSTGDLAGVPGYRVAGKTGTAQKIDKATNKYSEDKYIASFAGFFPANDPKISIVVIVDEPKGVYWGGDVCAPIFASIVREIAWYLKIPPVETRN
ncbi:MAG: penicillin-binding protein 2 [Elusimicrobiota bacterium]